MAGKKIEKKPSLKSPKAHSQNRELENLAKELKSLIPKLDEDGLAYLIEQAQIHLYNMQVDALNKTLIKSEERKAAKAPAKSGKTAEGKKEGFSEIKASESGASFYIIYKTEWIMFSRDEMIKLVKIASGEGTDLDIKERLFNWFTRERTDLLRSAGIANKFDNKLLSLGKLLRKYKVLRAT